MDGIKPSLDETYNLTLAMRILSWGSLMVAAPLWVGLVADWVTR